MHDYDRRTVAAAGAETTDTIYWNHVDHEKIAESALSDHQARLGKIETKTQIRENVVLTTGTTTDGRTFRIETTFSVQNMTVQSDARIVVEGTVSMGPRPEVLLRAEASVSKLLHGLTSLGLEKRDYFNFAKGWASVHGDIEAWGRGDVVDTKGLRSTLNYLVKVVRKIMEDLRRKFPGNLPILEMADEARKAIGAAARGIPDIG